MPDGVVPAILSDCFHTRDGEVGVFDNVHRSEPDGAPSALIVHGAPKTRDDGSPQGALTLELGNVT